MFMQVDTISIMISAIIYLNLGFSSSHNFARRIPVTFCLTLGVHLGFIYVMNFHPRMYDLSSCTHSVQCVSVSGRH